MKTFRICIKSSFRRTHNLLMEYRGEMYEEYEYLYIDRNDVESGIYVMFKIP